MSGAQLKEYVSMLYEMEKSIYQQERLMEGVVTEQGKLTKDPQKKEVNVSAGVGIVLGGAVLIGLAGIIWAVSIGSAFLGIVIGGLAIYPLGWGLMHLGFIHSDAKSENRYYEACVVSYEKQTPLREELASLARELPTKLEESKALLQQMYSIGVIYPKYQNLIAISSFYDYLMSGRCSELEGHEGAYNIYEMEARIDRIVTQLDVVIQKLDKIQQNQYMLYRAIQEGNKQNQELLGKLTSAVKGVNDRLDAQGRSIAYAAYEAELTRKELQYQSSMNRIYGNWR